MSWQSIAEPSAGAPVLVHGERRRFPSVMIETRQDAMLTAAGVPAWAARLAETYRLIEAEAVRFCGSSPCTCSATGQS